MSKFTARARQVRIESGQIDLYSPSDLHNRKRPADSVHPVDFARGRVKPVRGLPNGDAVTTQGLANGALLRSVSGADSQIAVCD